MSSTVPKEGTTTGEVYVIVPHFLAGARAQRHRRGVRFVPARRVIDVAGYELDLDRAANPAELLDWLIQIALKTPDPQRIRDVIDELEDACRAVFGTGIQGIYCPWGKPRVVDWRRGITRPARLEAVEEGNVTPPRRAPRKKGTRARREDA